MTALRFLELAAEQGLLDEKVVNQLRKQIQESTKPVSPDKVAKLLVDKQRLTSFQASKLLDRLNDDDDELTLLELDEDEAEAEEVTLLPTVEIVPDEPAAGSPLDQAAPLEEITESSLPASAVAPVVPVAPGPALEDQAAATAEGTPVLRRRRGLVGQVFALFRRSRRARPVYRWDSKLMLGGGGGLLLLLLAGGLLYVVLTRGSGDEMFQMAEQDYSSQSYGQAIAKYRKYLSRFASHPKASLAQVKIGLARMRQQVEANEWEPALQITREELDRIRAESAFSEVRPELAGILPTLYDGFVEIADQAETGEEKQRLLDLGGQVRQWIDDPEILPSSQRRSAQDRIELIQDRIALIRRDIKRERKLTSTVQDIEQAITEGDTAGAYARRAELLAEYPGLARHRELRKLNLQITRAEQQKIGAPQAEVATTDSISSAARSQVVLAKTSVASAVDSDAVLTALFRGALYGISAKDGQVLWRRWMGLPARIAPVPVRSATVDDVLVVNEERHELWRVQARDGQIQWRLPLRSPTTGLTVDGDFAWLTTADGKLRRVAWWDGNSQALQFPQPLTTAPAVAGGRLYQPSQQSSLFELEVEDLQCRTVTYLGQASNSMVVPPVVVGDALLLIENGGTDFCWMRAVSSGSADDGSLSVIKPSVRLEGQVHVPFHAFGNRALVATDRGGIYVFEWDPGNAAEPLRIIASSVPSLDEPLDTFPFTDRDRLFLAGNRLVELQLQAARGKLLNAWSYDGRELHVAAPTAVLPNVLVTFTRKASSDGLLVTALQIPGAAQEQPRRLWTTEVGQSPACPPLLDAPRKALHVVARSGDLWQIGAQELSRGVVGEAQRIPGTRGSVWETDQSADGTTTITFSKSSPLARFRPTASGQPWSTVKLLVPREELACVPVSIGEHLVMCTTAGQITLVDGKSGERLALPFQPPLSPGQQVSWLRPTLLDAPEVEIAAGTIAGRLLRLRLRSDPPAQLVAVSESQVAGPLRGPLASLADTVYLLRSGQQQDEMLAWKLNDPGSPTTWELPAGVRRGPQRIGELVLLELDSEELWAWSASADLQWKVSLPARLAGWPLLRGDELWLTSVNGQLWRLAQSTGERVAWSGDRELWELGEALGTGPLVLGERILLLGLDSTVSTLELPQP